MVESIVVNMYMYSKNSVIFSNSTHHISFVVVEIPSKSSLLG